MSVIIQQQHETEVFANNDGGITIRQSNQDTGQVNFIYLHTIHVATVVAALRAVKKEIEEAE